MQLNWHWPYYPRKTKQIDWLILYFEGECNAVKFVMCTRKIKTKTDGNSIACRIVIGENRNFSKEKKNTKLRIRKKTNKFWPNSPISTIWLNYLCFKALEIALIILLQDKWMERDDVFRTKSIFKIADISKLCHVTYLNIE